MRARPRTGGGRRRSRPSRRRAAPTPRARPSSRRRAGYGRRRGRGRGSGLRPGARVPRPSVRMTTNVSLWEGPSVDPNGPSKVVCIVILLQPRRGLHERRVIRRRIRPGDRGVKLRRAGRRHRTEDRHRCVRPEPGHPMEVEHHVHPALPAVPFASCTLCRGQAPSRGRGHPESPGRAESAIRTGSIVLAVSDDPPEEEKVYKFYRYESRPWRTCFAHLLSVRS
jgi:hypothetical protein